MVREKLWAHPGVPLIPNPSEINWSPVFANNEISVITRRTSL